MAILKKRQAGKTLLMGVTLLTLLAIAVPLVSAYEAHTINVQARVKEPFNVVKTIRLATEGEIGEFWQAHQGDDPPFEWPSLPNPPAVQDPYNVPINTCVVWVVTIGIQNPHDYPITEVVVTDHFGAELATGEPLDTMPVDVWFKSHSRGKGKKEPFVTQYRITWYVTWDDALENNSGFMEPGDTEFIELLVWTKLNPSGRQEYTTGGAYYTLNSGPTAKWFDGPPDEGGHQFSFDGEYVNIYALP